MATIRILIFLCFPILLFSESIPITLEFAQTEEEKSWGLMQRDWLPEDHGMLFIYEKPRYLSAWMFNCLIDLSIAFIDSRGIITEIHTLKAYPEMMDPNRPILSPDDLSLYTPDDPIVLFFRKHQATSSHPVNYALEMKEGWFKKHDVRPGDRLIWDLSSDQATIQLQNRLKRSIFSPKGE